MLQLGWVPWYFILFACGQRHAFAQFTNYLTGGVVDFVCWSADQISITHWSNARVRDEISSDISFIGFYGMVTSTVNISRCEYLAGRRTTAIWQQRRQGKSTALTPSILWWPIKILWWFDLLPICWWCCFCFCCYVLVVFIHSGTIWQSIENEL